MICCFARLCFRGRHTNNKYKRRSSTASFAKNANDSAQDDKVWEVVRDFRN
jgi:hypothetical protein